jgi:hypothetical protein
MADNILSAVYGRNPAAKFAIFEQSKAAQRYLYDSFSA